VPGAVSLAANFITFLGLCSAYARPMLGLRYAYATEAILLDAKAVKKLE